jgi:hypothetical protein
MVNRYPMTVMGTISRNEMDTHADTCCAGANWQLLDFTNEVCRMTPFLDLYEPVKEIMVARCGTVWTSPNTGHTCLSVTKCCGLEVKWIIHLLTKTKSMSMVYPCTITLSLSHSLVSTAMMTSFPSIPWGQLCTLRLMC